MWTPLTGWVVVLKCNVVLRLLQCCKRWTCRRDFTLAHTQTAAQDTQGSAQGGVYRCMASVSRGVLGGPCWTERLPPSNWNEQKDLPHRTGQPVVLIVLECRSSFVSLVVFWRCWQCGLVDTGQEWHPAIRTSVSRHLETAVNVNGWCMTTLWRCSVVVNSIGLINEVNRHWAWLVLGWVTVCGRVNHLGM